MKSPSTYNAVIQYGKHKLKSASILLFGYLYCISFSVFVALSFPIYLFRQIVILYAKSFRPDLGEIIIGQSAIHAGDLFSEKPPRGNIVVCMTVTGRPCPKDLKENMMMKNWIKAMDQITGELKYKKFQQYPVRWIGFYFFKNAFDTFDPSNHFYFHENPGKELTDQDVVRFTEKLLNSPFKPETSPWELHLLHGYRSKQFHPDKEMSLFMLKIHHCLADGYSILSAIVEGLCETPLSNLKMPVPQYCEKSTTQKIIDAILLPFNAFSDLSYGLSHELRKAPWKISDDNKAWYQYCAKSNPIPIQKIKKIKNTFGVSFTSVLLSAISAAIHKNLEMKKKCYKLLPEDDQGAMYFISALPTAGHDFNLTNHSTAAFFDMPTIRFEDPVQRLRALDALIDRTKNSLIPYIIRFYFKAVGCHLASVCSRVGKNRGASAGLTNFPSVPIHIQRGDNVAVSVDFSSGALAGNAGVGIMVLSYDQHIRFNLTAEKGLMSREETNQLVKDICCEVELLHQHVLRHEARC